MKRLVYIIFTFCTISLLAQNVGNHGALPVITPSPKQPNPYQQLQSFPNNQIQTNSYNSKELKDIQRNNEIIMKEVEEHQRYINAEIRRQSAIKMLIDSGFPSQAYQDPENIKYFYQAFDEINNMLKGEKPLNVGRTVFLIENAFYGNKLDYPEYQNFINHNAILCKQKIEEEKLDGNNNLVKNMMLFRLITDTLKFKNKGTENTLIHLPVEYDYNDYNSQQHYDSHFVSKLMKSGVGQCYSMPLYYLILAEAIGAEAYWSFSPKHSFVKIQDEKGRWYNIELTCGAILSDAHYMNNSYIKAEAIRNKLYLEPMNKTNVVAEMLIILARYYYFRYGLDDFYLQCANTAEQYLDNDLDAIMLKAEYQTRLTLTIANLLKAPTPEILKQLSPEAYKHYEKMNELYRQIDNLGYEEFPDDLYAKCLDYIATQKEKSEQNKKIFLNEIR